MDKTETLEFVKKYLEDIVAFFGLNLDVNVDVEDDIIIASIPSSERNSLLIGRGAETLRSLQYLLSTVLRNKETAINRINIDIADYKKQHNQKVVEKAKKWIEEIRQDGGSKVLDLNAADRWTVHHVAAEYDDIETHSEGEGRERKLIVSLKK